MEKAEESVLERGGEMKVIIFGAGKNTVRFLESCRFLDDMEILFIVDNDAGKWGTVTAGYTVESPEKITTAVYDKILVMTHFEDIKEQLVSEYGIPQDKITEGEYIIIPERCNMGSIALECEQDHCCDIANLNRNEVVTDNPLEEFFFFKEHRIINKWWHYFEVYNNYFQKYRGRNVRMLEIGVSKGGSLQMWRDYFGEKAVIVGIDIDNSCKQYEEGNIHVCIGSQEDTDFMKKVCEDFGPFDIVLDDGSHVVKHQIASFRILFPFLKNEGIYLCEDTHTSYWPSFGGSLRGDTFIEFAKSLVDELHHQHIDKGENEKLSPQFRDQIRGIYFYDSMVVFEKRKTGLSIWSMRGQDED